MTVLIRSQKKLAITSKLMTR